ncbi:MAG: hypothetical protein ACRDRE_20375, partial [Pseudonocardiaceae bacterium]
AHGARQLAAGRISLDTPIGHHFAQPHVTPRYGLASAIADLPKRTADGKLPRDDFSFLGNDFRTLH